MVPLPLEVRWIVASWTLPASKTATTIQCNLTLEDSLSKCKCQCHQAILSRTAIVLCQILATTEHHNNPNHKVYSVLARLHNHSNNPVSLEVNLRRLDYSAVLAKVLAHNHHQIIPMQEKETMEKTESEYDDFLTTEFIESSFFWYYCVGWIVHYSMGLNLF